MRLRNVESVTFTQCSLNPLFWGAQHANTAHTRRNTSPPNGGILTSAPPCSFEHGAPIFRVTDRFAERDRQDRRLGNVLAVDFSRVPSLIRTTEVQSHREIHRARPPPAVGSFTPATPVLLGHDHKLFGRVVNGIRVEQWRMQRRLLPGYGRKLRPARQVCIREYGFYRGFWGWRLIRE